PCGVGGRWRPFRLLSHERPRHEEPGGHASDELEGAQGRHERLRVYGRARSISRATTGGKLPRNRVSCGVPSRETMAMFRRPPVVLALTALWLVTSPMPRGLRAQGTDSIPAERRAARQWFRDAKLDRKSTRLNSSHRTI